LPANGLRLKLQFFTGTREQIQLVHFADKKEDFVRLELDGLKKAAR
jgi:hypothetical protein